jgi:5-methylcytosine-specific restriction protein A
MTGGLHVTRNPIWTHDETLLALDLYLRRRPQLPGEQDPEILELSRILRAWGQSRGIEASDSYRNPNGVSMKLGNLRRLDPSVDGAGLGNGSRIEEVVWSEFAENNQARKTAVAKIREEIRSAGVLLSKG